jgi:hypothetical protein
MEFVIGTDNNKPVEAISTDDVLHTENILHSISSNTNINDTESGYRKRKAKKQISAEVSVEDLRVDWTQCHYFMEKKRRLCNVGRTPGSLFCGTHKPNDEDCGSRANKKSKYKDLKVERIPCPLDPSHSIYKHDLDKHMKICNIKTNENKMEKELFYCLNCNSGNNIDHNNSDNKDNSNDNDNNNNKNIDNGDNNNDINNIVCPDSLLLKIEKCYSNLVSNGELLLLNDYNYSHDKNDKDDDGDNTCHNNTTINKSDNENNLEIRNGNGNDDNGCNDDSSNNKNDNNDINDTALTSMSQVSYTLLESRITAAVSGMYILTCMYTCIHI